MVDLGKSSFWLAETFIISSELQVQMICYIVLMMYMKSSAKISCFSEKNGGDLAILVF
jgi:hypothetical protein